MVDEISFFVQKHLISPLQSPFCHVRMRRFSNRDSGAQYLEWMGGGRKFRLPFIYDEISAMFGHARPVPHLPKCHAYGVAHDSRRENRRHFKVSDAS